MENEKYETMYDFDKKQREIIERLNSNRVKRNALEHDNSLYADHLAKRKQSKKNILLYTMFLIGGLTLQTGVSIVALQNNAIIGAVIGGTILSALYVGISHQDIKILFNNKVSDINNSIQDNDSNIDELNKEYNELSNDLSDVQTKIFDEEKKEQTYNKHDDNVPVIEKEVSDIANEPEHEKSLIRTLYEQQRNNMLK